MGDYIILMNDETNEEITSTNNELYINVNEENESEMYIIIEKSNDHLILATNEKHIARNFYYIHPTKVNDFLLFKLTSFGYVCCGITTGLQLVYQVYDRFDREVTYPFDSYKDAETYMKKYKERAVIMTLLKEGDHFRSCNAIYKYGKHGSSVCGVCYNSLEGKI